MAGRRTASYRTDHGRYTGRDSQTRAGRNMAGSSFYVYGSAVPKQEALPERRKEERPVWKQTSSQVKKNRNRALGINMAYAVFLSAAAVLAVFICVFYLRLQSDIVNSAETVTALQEELNVLTEENDTAYQAAEDSVDLGEVRRRAVNDLGMVYAAQGSVVEYESPAEDYVKQYNEIPESGILAKSGDADQ